MYRTSLVLDQETRRAARALALRYDCSLSEAIRRAVLHQRDALLGVAAPARRRRRQLLKQLFVLFEDNDPDEEIAQLKKQDAGF